MVKECKPIEEYRIGDKEYLRHTITLEDIQAFAKLTGDYNPLHLDADFAQETSFKKPVVYGMLSASFISTIIGMKIPGPGALWTSQTLEFLRQVFVGDTLSVVATVKQISLAANSLVLDIVITNQDDQQVLKGEATVQVLKVKEKKQSDSEQKNKLCLVLGGSSDIGHNISKRLLESGFDIALHYGKSKGKAEVIKESLDNLGNIRIFQADLSKEAEVSAMLTDIRDEMGHITAVVHCAAPHNTLAEFAGLKWEEISKQFQVQIGGLYNTMQLVLPEMLANNIAGKVVCVSSIAADDVPPPQQYDYVIGKAALSAFAKCLAVEFSPKGIAVNIVAPGMTDTERIADMPQKAKLMTKMQAPSRSLIQTDDVARAVVYLLEQHGCAVTGETIRVCGGIHMQ